MKLLDRKYLWKSLTWRVVSTILSLGLSLYFFGNWTEATQYTFVYAVASTILYYGHELLYKRYWK